MNWKEISESKIFKKDIMDVIIAEFVTPADALKITNAFLPMKLVSDDRIIGLRKNGAFGKTAPASLSGEPHHIAMLGGMYVEATTGYWRESILFHEDDFLKIRNPDKPGELWGQAMMGEGLNLLDLRLDNRIEQLSSDVVFSNGYSVSEYGVNYTYDAKIPPKYYINLAATAGTGYTNAPWIATPNDNRLWSDTTNSKPLEDLREVRRYAGRWGIEVAEVWMNSVVAGYIEDNATVQNYIKASPSLAEREITAEKIVEVIIGLKNFKVVVDDRFYNEETYFTSASAAADTTLVVQDASAVSDNDILVLRNASGREEDVTVNGTPVKTTPGAHVITIDKPSGGTVYAYAVGDRVTLAKPFIPNNKIALRARVNARNAPSQWFSTPSLIGGVKTPRPGRFTWSYFTSDNKVPLYAEVGAGIHGGPVVFAPGGWITIKVAA